MTSLNAGLVIPRGSSTQLVQRSQQAEQRGVPTIWTVGYEKLLPPALVAELDAAGVRRVIDVRYRPQSRRPGMSKTRLGELLAAHRDRLRAPPRARHAARHPLVLQERA